LQVEEISWSAITDRNGLAVFPDVSLAQIDRWHFTVTPLEEN
jgi:hypothetical protein